MKKSFDSIGSVIKKSICMVAVPAALLFAGTSGLVWDGNDPFHQPFNTTNYYGSGDVNNDGVVDFDDVTEIDNILNEMSDVNFRADVDANGVVDAIDAEMIYNVVNSNSILPGWWNTLETREERLDWLNRMLTIDKTDSLKWNSYFDCVNFSDQLYFNATGYRKGLNGSEYGGGQTLYNIPMYRVGMLGHVVNAVLVGDNPLEFSDWEFIEPQLDGRNPLDPNNLKYFGGIISSIEGGGLPLYVSSLNHLVSFELAPDGTVISMIKLRDDMVINRNDVAVSSDPVVNKFDQWAPHVADYNDGTLFFEQIREGLKPNTDIFFKKIDTDRLEKGTAITHNYFYSRILDTYKDREGRLHAVWSQRTRSPYMTSLNATILHGIFDEASGKIVDQTIVNVARERIGPAKVIVDNYGSVKVFWLDQNNNAGVIYCSTYTEEGWDTPVIITNNVYFHGLGNKVFDVALLQSGEILVSWRIRRSGLDYVLKSTMLSGGIWQNDESVRAVSSPFGKKVVGLEMEKDSKGGAHLVYWTEDNKTYYIQHDGINWLPEEAIEENNPAFFASLAVGYDNDNVVVWVDNSNGESSIQCIYNKGNGWSEKKKVAGGDSVIVSSPTIEYIRSKKSYVIAWTETANGSTQIKTRGLHYVKVFSGINGIVDHQDMKDAQDGVDGHNVGYIPVLEGEDIEVVVTPFDGYEVNYTRADNAVIGLNEEGNYVFENVSEYHAITVYFKKEGVRYYHAGRIRTNDFDSDYYFHRYPELQHKYGYNPEALLNHWKTEGIKAGRVASSAFDAKYYLNRYKDLKDGYGNNYQLALDHWNRAGIKEGRRGSSEFFTKIYANRYYDLRKYYGTNWQLYLNHWIKYGIREGRTGI
ncbi:MAG: dockerin type I domain-containing protein [Fibrobacterales bacterium]